MFTFIGDHDRPAPWRDPESVDGRGGFGQVWVYGATWLTLLKPGPLLFYGGQEGMFDAPCDEDYKAITFKWPVTINWSGVKDEYGGFVNYTLRMYQMIQERLGPGELHFTLLEPEDDVKQQQPWVGYVIHRADDEPPFSKWIAIVANPTDAQVKVECSRPDLGVSFKINLDSCGPHGVEAVCNIL